MVTRHAVEGWLRLFPLAALAAAFWASGACGPKHAPVSTPAPPTQAATAAPAPAGPTPAAAPAGTDPAGGAPTAARPPAPPPLVGRVTRAALHEYAPWKAIWDQAPYAPDPSAVAAIKSNAPGVTILAIVATWCPDTKRELPRYFATMDAAGVGDAGLTMVGVDRSKKDAEGLTEQYGITRVPTFVFLRGGREIGRFVERTPGGSTFEAELAKILSAR